MHFYNILFPKMSFQRFFFPALNDILRHFNFAIELKKYFWWNFRFQRQNQEKILPQSNTKSWRKWKIYFENNRD